MVPGSRIVAAVSRATNCNVELVGPTDRGESRSTFDVLVGGEQAILKLLRAETGVLNNQRRLVGLVDGLRARGYPAPEYVAVGSAGDFVFTVQRRIGGDTLEPGPGVPVDAEVLGAILPAVLEAVELQADGGDLRSPPWPRWLLDTIEHGGDGYCLHATMRARPDTAAVLSRVQRVGERCGRGRGRSHDIVHFDLSPANIIHENGRLTGIVDWNVPFDGAAQGDRGFDVVTLLFLSEMAGPRSTRRTTWTVGGSVPRNETRLFGLKLGMWPDCTISDERGKKRRAQDRPR